MGFLGTLLGLSGTNEKVTSLLESGAKIIDVRSRNEYAGGHVKGSINIPLPEIDRRFKEIKKLKSPVVLCCASGARSGQATRFLKTKGIDCENGGGWRKLA